MEVEKTINGSLYKYSLLQNDKELAYIKGSLLTREIVISLSQFNTIDKLQEKMYGQKIGKVFYEDCKRNDTTIIITNAESTEKVVWFLQKNKFTFTHYVFENDLEKLEKPLHTFQLKKFSAIDLPNYQKMYFECSKGDPEVDLTGLTYKTFFQKEKREIEYLWDESLMHLVFLENTNTPIGVLNLRTEQHQNTNIKEGSINYLGLLENYRNRGLGKALHLTGLQKLKDLGCKNYFGGTNSNNNSMLKIFKKNNCTKTQTQHYYKAH